MDFWGVVVLVVVMVQVGGGLYQAIFFMKREITFSELIPQALSLFLSYHPTYLAPLSYLIKKILNPHHHHHHHQPPTTIPST